MLYPDKFGQVFVGFFQFDKTMDSVSSYLPHALPALRWKYVWTDIFDFKNWLTQQSS